MKTSRLRWISFTSSKDLHLVNAGDLDVGTYRRLLDQFIRKAESVYRRPDGYFLNNMNDFARRNILFAHKYENSDRYNRSGYFNLYRWCTTEHYAAYRANASAIKLWKFLFSTVPSGLGHYCDNFLIVDEAVWKAWYPQLSEGVTRKEKVLTALKSIVRHFK